MNRALTVLLALALVGCSLFKPSDSAKNPEAPESSAVVESFDKYQTKSDEKVAAAVAEARAQNKAGDLKKVENELSVAASFLPAPKPENLAEAHARAERMNAEEYKSAVAYGMALQKKIDDAWDKMEKATHEAQQIAKLKNAEIEQLKKEITEAKKDAARNLYGMAAVALLTLGGIAFALSRYVAGGGLMISGVIVGGVPFLLDSVWFIPCLGFCFLVILFVILWHVFHPTQQAQAKP